MWRLRLAVLAIAFCFGTADFTAVAQPLPACSADMQSCPSGPAGWGGCFKPSEARCLNGMVCQMGEEFCAPNAASPGGCYNPKEATCIAGQVCDIGWSACPAGPRGIGGCYRPEAADCRAGLVCGKDEADCGSGSPATAEAPAPTQKPELTVTAPMAQPVPPWQTAPAPLPSWPAPRQSVQSQPSTTTPVAASCGPPSAGDRRAMLDSVRPTVAQALRQAVEFKVRTVRLCGNWGFVMAEPQRPGGGAIQWSRTVCRGDTSHLVGALVQRDGSGAWRLVEHALCPSDVAWSDWTEKYGVPEQLFGEE